MSKGYEAIDRQAVEALYRRYGAAVQRRARTLMGSDAAAADAVQEVFIRVLDHYDRFRGESSPMTWLYRVTTNLCLNRLRDERRRGELLQQVDRAEPPSGRRIEMSPDVRRLLCELSPKIAAAGVYYHLDGMSHQEIAAALEVSRRTVGNLVARFDREMKKRLR